jgi:hypothetical protein
LNVDPAGSIKSLADMMASAWRWRQDRRDPVRLQAERLIRAFEAYGVRRQQIVRLLPADMRISASSFSTADKLKDVLSPALLDWTARHLALNRPWLDGLDDEQPHLVFDEYKNESAYRAWFEDRRISNSETHRFLYVWSPVIPTPRDRPSGPLCLVYEEIGEGLDGKELSRYWRLSRGWDVHHAPCVTGMLAVAAIARSQGIDVIGRVVSQSWLRQFEVGAVFAPEVRFGTLWHPDDLNPSDVGF